MHSDRVSKWNTQLLNETEQGQNVITSSTDCNTFPFPNHMRPLKFSIFNKNGKWPVIKNQTLSYFYDYALSFPYNTGPLHEFKNIFKKKKKKKKEIQKSVK